MSQAMESEKIATLLLVDRFIACSLYWIKHFFLSLELAMWASFSDKYLKITFILPQRLFINDILTFIIDLLLILLAHKNVYKNKVPYCT